MLAGEEYSEEVRKRLLCENAEYPYTGNRDRRCMGKGCRTYLCDRMEKEQSVGSTGSFNAWGGTYDGLYAGLGKGR